MNKFSNKILTPLLKYPGGKGSELPIILNNMPQKINRYIEPFLGGGAVYFAVEAAGYYVNDISTDLMLLYEYIKNGNKEFFSELVMIESNWEQLNCIVDMSFEFFIDTLNMYRFHEITNEDLKLIITANVQPLNILDLPLFRLDKSHPPLFKIQLIKNMVSMIKRINKNEIKKGVALSVEEIKDNFECAVKSAYYMYFRELYNHPIENNLSNPRKVAIYLFIREYCYSSMFRFNSDGEFNVPYGGISYNKKNLKCKIEYFKTKNLIDKLQNTLLSNKDFYKFVNSLKLTNDDFMFLDPPYDTNFSQYDKNEFNKDDQIRLANYLKMECSCNFMLVIKKTDFIERLYKSNGMIIKEFNKSYSVSFQNRNNKDATHLIITNY
ncbi:MAG: DNA adenine methylase [Clostridiales bacterium]|nr:DNA adenine methylase [Clostridiales bacterium]